MSKVINHHYQAAVVSGLVLTPERTMSDGTEFSKRDKKPEFKVQIIHLAESTEMSSLPVI